MIRSMTGFATRTGTAEGSAWTWEMRGVNGRGLDLRLRLPEGAGGLEPVIRERAGKALARGSINIVLRLSHETAAGELALDAAHLDRVLEALNQIEAKAQDAGVSLAPTSAADVLAVRGVVAGEGAETELSESIFKALAADLDALLTDFNAMRAAEGERLRGVIEEQLERIAALTGMAAEAAEARREETRGNLSAALRRVLDEATEMPQERVAQELALLAVKQDVTEELDRLKAHVTAARELLAAKGPSGRKLDFLAQEFNREANTLCSKSQNTALTTIGLELKAVVDQMREQIQNVE